MASRVHSPAGLRRRPSSRPGLRLVVFHASPDMLDAHRVPQAKPSVHRHVLFAAHGTHPAAGDRCGRRIVGACSRAPAELAATPGARAGEADRVVFGQPGRRGRRTLAGARLCQSPGGAPLSVVEVQHQVALASPADLATRLRLVQPMLRRYLGRVEVINEMHRAVNASLDPTRVADALAARAAAWLPAASWAVVGPESSDGGSLMAERGLAPDAEMTTRAVGAWVLDHAREYASASLCHDSIIARGCPTWLSSRSR